MLNSERIDLFCEMKKKKNKMTDHRQAFGIIYCDKLTEKELWETFYQLL